MSEAGFWGLWDGQDFGREWMVGSDCFLVFGGCVCQRLFSAAATPNSTVATSAITGPVGMLAW